MIDETDIAFGRCPRTVRDASVAAAVGVAIEMAIRENAGAMMGESDTPWMVAGRVGTHSNRVPRPRRGSWGQPAGWDRVTESWGIR